MSRTILPALVVSPRLTSTAAKVRETVDILTANPGHGCDGIELLASGAMGADLYDAVRRLSPTTDRRWWLTRQMLVTHCELTPRHANAAWDKLPPTVQERLHRAADEAIEAIDNPEP